MGAYATIGKLLIYIGIALSIAGFFMNTGAKIPILGKLPGDLSFQVGNGVVCIPIASSILVSIILTIIVNMLITK